MSNDPARQPAISVIITTYNRAPIVGHAINSILTQTFPAAEIILVDDGSSDDTPAVLKDFGSQIRVLRQANAGMSAARNAGIRAAKHEWITFLDDDDEFAPDRLAVAAAGIARLPDAAVHVCNALIVAEGAEPIDLFKLRGLHVKGLAPLDRPLEWVFKGCFFMQSLVLRRAVFSEHGLFRDKLTAHDDLEFLFRLSDRVVWAVDPSHSLRLIRRPQSGGANLSSAWRTRAVERTRAIVSIYREVLTKNGLYPRERGMVQEGLATYLFETGANLLETGDPRSARACFAEAAQLFSPVRSRLKAASAYVLGRPVLRLIKLLGRRHPEIVR